MRKNDYALRLKQLSESSSTIIKGATNLIIQKQEAVTLLMDSLNNPQTTTEEKLIYIQELKDLGYQKCAAKAYSDILSDTTNDFYCRGIAAEELIASPEYKDRAIDLWGVLDEMNASYWERVFIFNILSQSLDQNNKELQSRLIQFFLNAMSEEITHIYEGINAAENLSKIPEYEGAAVDFLFSTLKKESYANDKQQAIDVIFNIPSQKTHLVSFLMNIIESSTDSHRIPSLTEITKVDALGVLLKIPEQKDKALEGLINIVIERLNYVGVLPIALDHNYQKSIELLSRTPEHQQKLIKSLIGIIKRNKKEDINTKMRVLKVLLDIPECSDKAAELIDDIVSEKIEDIMAKPEPSLSSFMDIDYVSHRILGASNLNDIPALKNKLVDRLLSLIKGSEISNFPNCTQLVICLRYPRKMAQRLLLFLRLFKALN